MPEPTRFEPHPSLRPIDSIDDRRTIEGHKALVPDALDHLAQPRRARRPEVEQPGESTCLPSYREGVMTDNRDIVCASLALTNHYRQRRPN